MQIGKALVVAIAILGLSASTAFAQDYVTVERRGSPAGTVLRNTIAGGLVGSAVSGGIILYEMGVNDNEDYNWERTLAWGAAIGLGAGLIWGIVDATSGPSYGEDRRGRRCTTGSRCRSTFAAAIRARGRSFPVFAGRF